MLSNEGELALRYQRLGDSKVLVATPQIGGAAGNGDHEIVRLLTQRVGPLEVATQRTDARVTRDIDTYQDPQPLKRITRLKDLQFIFNSDQVIPAVHAEVALAQESPRVGQLGRVLNLGGELLSFQQMGQRVRVLAHVE